MGLCDISGSSLIVSTGSKDFLYEYFCAGGFAMGFLATALLGLEGFGEPVGEGGGEDVGEGTLTGVMLPVKLTLWKFA